MGFRTGVRLPSGPLESQASNTVQKIKIAVFKNVFSLSVDFNQFQTENDDSNSPVTFARIQKWVKDKYGIHVSKSSITQVKSKCGITSFDTSQKVPAPFLKSEKEKMVLEAFKEFGLVEAGA